MKFLGAPAWKPKPEADNWLHFDSCFLWRKFQACGPASQAPTKALVHFQNRTVTEQRELVTLCGEEQSAHRGWASQGAWKETGRMVRVPLHRDHTPFAICLLLQLSFWILLLLYHAELLVIASLHLAASVPLHISTYWVDGWLQHSGWWRDEPGRTSDLIRWVGKVKMGVGIFVLDHQL